MAKRVFFVLFVIVLFLIAGVLGCSSNPAYHDIQFSRSPCIKPYKEYNYQLCESIVVEVDNRLMIIPKEFETDLASIPRPFWTFVSPNQSNLIAPTILHDYLYSCHNQLTRQEVDEVLYNSLLIKGVSTFRAYLFYVGVRCFVWPHYHPEVPCETIEPRRPAVIPDSDANEDGEYLTCQDVAEGNATFK